METYKKIIVRMPNWIGDAVMATPLLEDIRTHFPHAHITALSKPAIQILLEGNPFLNENLYLEKQRNKTLRKERYDLGILLTNSFSSAYLFWRLKVKERIGFRIDGRKIFLTKSLPIPQEKGKEHLVQTYKRLLSSLNLPLSSTSPALYLSEEEKKKMKEFLRGQGINLSLPLIGINPGAAYGSAKCWLPERFEEVTHKLLQKTDATLLYFGDSATRGLVDAICRPFKDNKRVLNLAGKTTLRELMAAIFLCDVFLTNDSGPMHIAAAFQTPLVALFGSTNEIATGPYGNGVVIHKHVSCSPCYKRVCPIDFKCMKSIGSEEVFSLLYQEIAKTRVVRKTPAISDFEGSDFF